MQYKGFNLLKIRIDRGVAFITIDNPPMNILTMHLLMELNKFARKVEKDDDVRVIVFDSADPDFFIAHFELDALILAPETPPPRINQLQGMHPVLEAYRTMPKVTIAKIEGITRGGGSEFVLALDMRFGAIGKTILGQPEIMLGIITGGGSSQRLPRLVGQARAMEIILSGMDFSAELAERYGYINRALPPDGLGQFVEDLAFQIASYPAKSIALAKKSIQNAGELSLVDGLIEETQLFNQSTALPIAKKRMRLFLEYGGETREIEKDLLKLVKKLTEKLQNEE